MLWDVASRRLQQTFYGEAGFALGVAFVDRATAVASYNTGNLRVWDLAGGRRQKSYAVNAFMPSFAQIPDNRLAAVGLNNAIRLLDLQSGETIRELALEPGAESLLDSGNVTALAFNPSGTELVSGAGDGRLFLWDGVSGELVQRFDGHAAFVHDVVFSPDGRLFLSVSDDARLILWDGVSGETRFTYTHPTDVITSVAFSPDGRLFAAGAGTTRYVANFDLTTQRDARILLWETATGAEVGQLAGHTGPVTAVAFSPDGRYLLSGALDATLRLWDVASGELLRRFDGHAGGVMAVAFSADGLYAASGAQDGTVIIWDVASGDLLRQIKAHDGVVHHVAFTASGDGLWSAAEDGAVYLWATALDPAALQEWIAAHRHVSPLTCLQQIQYGLADHCPDSE